MNYLVLSDKSGGTAHLTTDHPSSENGIPVLHVLSDDINGAFTSTDIFACPSGNDKQIPAADVVASWMLAPCRLAKELLAGEIFLSQVPGYNYRECLAAKATTAEE